MDMDEVWGRLFDNKNDEIENTFCFVLFELRYFDEALFVALCKDMECVILKEDLQPKANYKILVWIISSIFRSVFSHFDKMDNYKIKNFDEEISGAWSGEYLEKLRGFLEEIFSLLNKEQGS